MTLITRKTDKSSTILYYLFIIASFWKQISFIYIIYIYMYMGTICQLYEADQWVSQVQRFSPSQKRSPR